MSFRTEWQQLSREPSGGVEKDAVARFVKTLYAAGLAAARDEARRNKLEPLLKILKIPDPLSPSEVATSTRRVAARAVALLRKIQNRGDQ